jgi:hypothetical protein
MDELLAEEMRKTAAAKTPDRKTGRLAKLFCEQAFQITGVRIVDNKSAVGPDLDFNFTNELEVIGVVNQMCHAYGLTMDIGKPKQEWIVTISKPDDHTITARPATSPILRRAVLQAGIYAHATYVAPAFRQAQASQQAAIGVKHMRLPQFDIPGMEVSIQYPADISNEDFEMLRSKIAGVLQLGTAHDDE